MYQTFFTIAIEHEYYPAGKCPVRLDLSMETTREAAMRDVICMPDISGRTGVSWEGGPEVLRDMPLEFLLVVMDDTFHHVTREIVENPAFRLETFNRGVGMQMLTVDVGHVLENGLLEIKIRMTSREKFLEYLCVPKFSEEGGTMRMEEEQGRLKVVETPGPVCLPDGTPARRFVSTEMVKLRRDSGLTMLLWESRDGGERLIANAIESPDPRQSSPFSPMDTISRIFYY
jgi:hypothetical protein